MPTLLLFYPASLFIHPPVLSLFFLIFLSSKLGECRVLWLHCGQGKLGICVPSSSSSSVCSDSGLVFFRQLQKSPQLLPRMGNVFLELVIHASFDFKLFTTMLSFCE